LELREIKGDFPLGDQGVSVPVVTYYFDTPFPVGTWTLNIASSSQLTKATPSPYDALINVWNENDVKLYGRLATYDMQVDQEVGLVATLFSQEANPEWRSVPPTAAPIAVSDAAMEITLPSGKEIQIPMHDDGLHGDGEANDGTFGATFKAPVAGTYRAQAFLSGTDSNDVLYTRSTQHLFRVVPSNVDFSGVAQAVENVTSGMLTFWIELDYTPEDSAQDQFYAYAEVWGTNSSGLPSPVAWVGAQVQAERNSAGVYSIPLSLSLKWFNASGINAPITLRNAYLQNDLVPVANAELITVIMPPAGRVRSELFPYTGVIDEIMYWGPRPQWLKDLAAAPAAPDAGSIMLIHGYCSFDNPFAHYGSWTNPVFFENFDSSIGNDAFAKKILQVATDRGLSSFGAVGHSQGGLASTHLHNYYWSPLENASGGRRIQTVGSPYKGTTLAGNLADMGDVFGVGCGSNFDLTTDGAQLWLSGVSSEATSGVYYFTTQYDTSGLFHYCNLAANLVLDWPNDGVTEQVNSQLPGANYVSHLKGECHTYDMNWPPQCWSTTRDATINSAAAR